MFFDEPVALFSPILLYFWGKTSLLRMLGIGPRLKQNVTPYTMMLATAIPPLKALPGWRYLKTRARETREADITGVKVVRSFFLPILSMSFEARIRAGIFGEYAMMVESIEAAFGSGRSLEVREDTPASRRIKGVK